MVSAVALVAALAVGQLLPQESVQQSPKQIIVELKGAPLWPQMGRGLPGADALVSGGPWGILFGQDPMPYAEVELDYMLFQKFGSLSLGFAVGYGQALTSGVSLNEQDSRYTATKETVGLRFLPGQLLAVYRFDLLNLRFGIPFVPYVKFGLAAAMTWFLKGDQLEVVTLRDETGEVSIDPVTKVPRTFGGFSVRFGYVATAGLALALDFLDPRLARDFDSSMGVNHSYLFFEVTYRDLANFQDPARLNGPDLSTLHWMAGLALEI